MPGEQPVISGYRELSQDELALIEKVKQAAQAVAALVEEVETGSNSGGIDVDKGWVSIAKTDLQKGFMALTRSVARPDSF
jgi:hypothetical protein